MMSTQVIKTKKDMPLKKKEKIKKKKTDKVQSSIRITFNKSKKVKKKLNRIKSQTLKDSKPNNNPALPKALQRTHSQDKLGTKQNLEPPKTDITNRRSFTFKRMREVNRSGRGRTMDFKPSNIIKTVSSRSRRLKRMNRSVYYGGEERRKFLNDFFEMAHSSKAIGVGDETEHLKPGKDTKNKKPQRNKSQSSMEEFDIYATNSSRPREPSVQNEFEPDLEENPPDFKLSPHSHFQKSPSESLPIVAKNSLIRVRNSFVFGKDSPVLDSIKQTQELQCIQEFGQTAPLLQIDGKAKSGEIDSVFGLCHCPGKNHSKTVNKKANSSNYFAYQTMAKNKKILYLDF